MRTFNFAATIRRVFAIRNNAAAIVTGKRSSHKPCRWHAATIRRARPQCASPLRLVARCTARRRSYATGHEFPSLQPCSVATQRICVEPVERS